MQYIRPELIELLTAWLVIRAYTLSRDALDPTGLTVAIPDAVSEDMPSLAQTLLAAANAASIETRVRLIWPEADETWIKAEVQRILERTVRRSCCPPSARPPAVDALPEDDPWPGRRAGPRARRRGRRRARTG